MKVLRIRSGWPVALALGVLVGAAVTPMAALAQALPELTLEQRQQIEAFNPGIFERLEELGRERFMRQMLPQNRVNPRIYRYIDAAV
jgi:hypothetical protein